MIKVLLADDHTIVRDGLRQILEDTSDISVSAEASDGHKVMELVRGKDIDIVLLDMSMPGLNGLDVLKLIKAEKKDLPVLILSMYPEEQYAVRSLRAGASGYLTKESASEELIKAIRKVSEGGKYITSSLAEKLAYDIITDSKKLAHETLSDREYQVFIMIASGKSATDIAEELSLSVKTISTYRSRILEKMNLKNNAQLIYYAMQNGLVHDVISSNINTKEN